MSDQTAQHSSGIGIGLGQPVGRRRVSLFTGQLFGLFLLFQIYISSVCLAGHPPLKEFRGVWIATVNNIDWPSAPGLPVEVQKSELKALIERIERLNLNVVIFQVRPAADAFYPSETEPWSYFLTGKQGLAPSPSFDPLGYAIGLCHSKGMELHAWFNPFRARNDGGYYKLYPGSFAAKNPQYIHLFDNKLIFDPGIPQVRNHMVKVIMEVVRKYNIDAIHIDDYFYPYPVRGQKFPDVKTFGQYGKGFYPKRLNDWRRDNINRFIKALHDSIKAVKPQVKLGISPFGVWRNKSDDPNGSPGIKALTSYDDLYADVYKWLANDWIDYVIPQLYWEQGNRFNDFTTLAKWWNDHCFGKPLYLGQALYKSTGTSKGFANPKEISEQISILRKFENVGGFALFSATNLVQLSESILNELYTKLLPTKEDNPHSVRPFVIVEQISPQQPSNPTIEKATAEDKILIDKSVILPYKPLINKELPVPEQFSVVKSRKGWVISWETTPSVQDNRLKYSVIIFEPVKGGDTLKTVFKTTMIKEVFIPKESTIRPSKVYFGIVSVNNKGDQSLSSKLFKVRGRRIIYK